MKRLVNGVLFREASVLALAMDENDGKIAIVV
jgi:hypothetical protein